MPLTKAERIEYQAVIERCNGVSELGGGTPICIHHIIGRRNGTTHRLNLIALTPKEHDLVHSDTKHWTNILLEMNGTTRDECTKKSKYAEFKF